MKPAGLLGCGSILPAACREDEERAETSKFPALEVLLEGGGERDSHGQAGQQSLSPLNPRETVSQQHSILLAALLGAQDVVGSESGDKDQEGQGSTHSTGLQHLADEQGQGLRGRATPHLSTPGMQRTKAQAC